MTKKAIGLNEQGIQIGFYESEVKPTVFTTLGSTFKETAILEEAEGEEILCECEESDDPEDIHFIQGKTTLKFSTSDLNPESCYAVYGGTLTNGKWNSPKVYKPRIVSVKFETRSGIPVTIERAILRTRMNWAIKKNGYGLLEHTVTKLSKSGDLSGGLSIGTETTEA